MASPLLTVFGGTGRAGRLIASEAAARGIGVRAVGRSADPSAMPPGVTAWPGDVLSRDDLDNALRDATAVVVALSIPRTSRSPFAAVTGPLDLHSRSISLILDSMRRHGVQRLVKLSAQGVGDSAPRAGWLFRALVATSNLRPAFADHAVADDHVRASDRRWTILRPPMLGDGPAVPLAAGEDLTTGSATRVPREALARYVIDILDDRGTEGRVLSLRPR